MAVNFPLTLPGAPGFTRFDIQWPGLTGRSGGGLAAAPQVYEWDDLPMRATCQLPVFGEGAPAPHSRVELGQWEATLLALTRGGTFLQGDPKHAALLGAGPAGTVDGFPTSNAANNAGAKELSTRGWGASRGGFVKRGDIFQVAKNYLTQPRDFSHADWVKGGDVAPTVTANQSASPDPDAAVEADQINFGVVGVGQFSTIGQVKTGIGGSSGVAAGHTFIGSVWLKAVSGTPTIVVSVKNSPLTEQTDTPYVLSSSAWTRATSQVTFSKFASVSAVQFEIYSSNQAAVSVYGWGAILYSPQLDARLVKFTDDVDESANSAGQSSLPIWPRLRAAAPDFSPLILTSAVGTWRLGRMGIERTMDRGKLCSMGFDAVEAITL